MASLLVPGALPSDHEEDLTRTAPKPRKESVERKERSAEVSSAATSSTVITRPTSARIAKSFPATESLKAFAPSSSLSSSSSSAAVALATEEEEREISSEEREISSRRPSQSSWRPLSEDVVVEMGDPFAVGTPAERKEKRRDDCDDVSPASTARPNSSSRRYATVAGNGDSTVSVIGDCNSSTLSFDHIVFDARNVSSAADARLRHIQQLKYQVRWQTAVSS